LRNFVETFVFVVNKQIDRRHSSFVLSTPILVFLFGGPSVIPSENRDNSTENTCETSHKDASLESVTGAIICRSF